MAVEFATIKLSFISPLGVQSIRCVPKGIQVLVASLVAASASLAGLTRAGNSFSAIAAFSRAQSRDFSAAPTT
jgi:hypothetical protein